MWLQQSEENKDTFNILVHVPGAGASLYAPYSLLLISNKFWMGGGGGGGVESEGEKQGGRVRGGE